ncbi:WXG100 family type VII secretion target [Amycolatopsis nigrescens]|uniref:WXG100 family type VII secretion target n=1 Tax=Amycolatopsis nigrescens TaxID=381445 RepID=UPI0003622EC5|nr:WXG100 family type VII secretion target [Amycolatopsis nigrescens]
MTIKVDYATINAAAEDCKSTGGELEALFGDLKKQLNPLVETWTGSAQTEYQALQKQWDDSFTELKQLLAQIATALPQIADGYQSTESSVTKLMGN